MTYDDGNGPTHPDEHPGESVSDSPTPENGTSGQSKGGPPKANRNSMRHGLYSPRSGNSSGFQFLDRRCNEFQRQIENAVIEAHGAVSVEHASIIQTAVQVTKSALRLTRKLSDAEGVTLDQTLEFERSIANLYGRRDAAVAKLKLSQGDDNPLAFLNDLPRELPEKPLMRFDGSEPSESPEDENAHETQREKLYGDSTEDDE